jgi:hypothetical protein
MIHGEVQLNHLKIIGIRVLVTIIIATGLPLFYLLWVLSLDAGAQRKLGEQAAYSFIYGGLSVLPSRVFSLDSDQSPTRLRVENRALYSGLMYPSA